MLEIFIAYASGNSYHNQMIRSAAEAASTDRRKLLPWSSRDTSGAPVAGSVEDWIQKSDAFIADISVVNDNVTYEIGYAIGLGKSIRLIRSEHISFESVKRVALLNTLGHDSYTLENSLTKIFKKEEVSSNWSEFAKNREQPVFLLNPPKPTDLSLHVSSAVKKTARLKFRSYNPWEVSRLNASEAYEMALSSYGIILYWVDGSGEEALRNNQRASFLFGVARGRGIPVVLLAHECEELPLDLHDQATRWHEYSDIDKIIRKFRDDVADLQIEFVEQKPEQETLISQVNCGDPTAENEAAVLSEYFLETDAYQRTLEGAANVLVGRKGSGKTAVFLQVRDRTRAHKDNIVIDLMPEGYQLIKLKEFILDQLSFGARKEVVAAFWEYVLWLEIAYKLLEKDKLRATRDPILYRQYEHLEQLFRTRVDTGTGDFSERLRRLSLRIIERFSKSAHDPERLDSSEVLEIIYGQDIRELRDAVSSYLKIKGYVFFLLDNLDRFWTPGGFTEDDALIVIGLIESMQEITRKLTKTRIEFRWSIFVRSDVYEFLVRGMADYGKLSVQSLEWSDRELLKVLFERRAMSAIPRTLTWKELWPRVSVLSVFGKPVLDFLVDGSLMRPRYLIRLFETARRRAITFGRQIIDESDYHLALNELGWQVIEDLSREVADIVSEGEDLLFEILQAGPNLTAAKFRYLASKKLNDSHAVEKLLDVMIWSGALGVEDGSIAKYIFDYGYKRQYMATLIEADPEIHLQLHPTLIAALH